MAIKRVIGAVIAANDYVTSHNSNQKTNIWLYYLFRVSKMWQVIVSEHACQPEHTYEHVTAIYLQDSLLNVG
jgi:hypothetical protein